MAPGIHVIVQSYDEPRPERRAELVECVRRNLDNAQIAAVHDLLEAETSVPEPIRGHPKYRRHRIGRRLTYAEAVAYANRRLAGEIVCLCNLDIILDPASDWASAGKLAEDGIVLCLSRHEFDGRTVFRDPDLGLATAHSQDAWVFRPPIEIADCDFELGMMGCDNAFAERLKRSGHIPLNWPRAFRILHYDRSRGKHGGNALSVHAAEAPGPTVNRHPEERGYYLLPDLDAARSIDRLLDALEVPELERYRIACDLLSRFVAVRNREAE